VQQQGIKTFRIVLTQGLNRQIRRMCETLGYKVATLKRVRIMTLKLGDLPTGHWRYLTLEEMKSINQLVAQSSKTEDASSKPKAVKVEKKTADEENEDLLTEEEFGVKVHSVKKSAPKAEKEPFLRDPKVRRAERFSKPTEEGSGSKPAAAAAGKPARKSKPASGKNQKTKSEHVSGKTQRSPKGSLAPRNPKAASARKPKPGADQGSKRTAGTRGKGRR